ncbi:thiol reductant ABC exporter subunit CydC [Rossellomorea vietnamensis]|uniref:Thiol reductant ABC exporter subunit CydC n=1 Tax=Rossellomorea vietnamensis TaxID=218284 RepID=A0ACD4CCG8_9BACI|nr:thiol reductant ABC exporter subunit CydC [Rossellomorea vietnamensis]UXH45934.1 thiol reductant ABC exporter subunit CydC [Rossellomorea vietnamensis]
MKELQFVVKLMMKEKKDVVYSILLGFLAGITSVGLFASSGYLISKAALEVPLYALTVMIALLKLFGLTKALSRYGERYFSHRATFTILANLRVSIYEKIEPLAPGIFGRYRSGDLLARIVGDVESLQNFFLRVFYPPVILVMVFLSTVLFTVYYSVSIALVLLGGLLLTGYIVPAYFAYKQRKVEGTLRERRGELSTEVTEFLYGFRDLKIYRRLEEKEASLVQAATGYVSEQERESRYSLFSHSTNILVSLIISWIVLALGAYSVAAGQLDGIFLAMLVMISLTVFENATPMAILPAHFEDSRRAATRLSTITPEEPVERDGPPMASLLEGDVPSFCVKDVSFSFDGEERKTLDSVSLELPAGSKTAIVGPSGSGKSTLLQLLLHFYPTDEGAIFVNDASIKDIDKESLWGYANVVLQENHFFYGTIKENLMLVRDDLTDAEMKSALDKVKLDHISLEDEVLEKGENLSGGEKQRLAIARALLKDAPLWMLDEPTSSVDALMEKEIFDHLYSAAEGDTLVLISHRLTGLEKMDQIIVMDQGSVVESGSYQELMSQKGYFYEMKQIEKSVLF